jgi:hypothetical protein
VTMAPGSPNPPRKLTDDQVDLIDWLLIERRPADAIETKVLRSTVALAAAKAV